MLAAALAKTLRTAIGLIELMRFILANRLAMQFVSLELLTTPSAQMDTIALPSLIACQLCSGCKSVSQKRGGRLESVWISLRLDWGHGTGHAVMAFNGTGYVQQRI